jgi:hypothetical protein
LSKCGFPSFDKRGYWQIKWFAENGWTSRFCGCNLKFVKGNRMKIILTILLFLNVTTLVRAEYIPTPDSAMTILYGKDTRQWVLQYTGGDRNSVLAELVPNGDSVKAWKEMIQQQTVFTSSSVTQFADDWKKGLLEADPKATMMEETNQDGSISLTYTSSAMDGAAFRRFVKGKDGIYMLTYLVHLKLKNEAMFKIWSDNIRASTLVHNREKKWWMF